MDIDNEKEKCYLDTLLELIIFHNLDDEERYRLIDIVFSKFYCDYELLEYQHKIQNDIYDYLKTLK